MSILKYNRKGVRRFYYQFMESKVYFRGGGFSSLKECREAEAKRRVFLTKPSKISFESLLEEYFKALNFQTPGWLKEKRRLVDRWFRPWYPLPFHKINMNLIQQHLEKRTGVRNGTVNRDLVVLKSIFNFARKQGWIERSPCDLISKRPVEEVTKYVPPLEDFKKVLDIAAGRDKILLELCFLTGGRIGEILKLKWEDVNQDYLVLRSRKHHHGDLRSRQIPLSEALRAVLNIPKDGEFVITNRCYPWGTMGRLCRKAGVRHFGWHSIRHLSTSILGSLNTPLIDISCLLGHTNLSTTRGYLHSLGLQSASDRLSELFRNFQ